jgi:hypothetical protein
MVLWFADRSSDGRTMTFSLAQALSFKLAGAAAQFAHALHYTFTYPILSIGL